MRPVVPLLVLAPSFLSLGCLGGEPVAIITDDSEAPVETDLPDTGPEEPIEQEVPFTNDWDPDDFYAVIDVGPDQEYTNPCDIGWSALQGGTMVRIHWQEEPYRCKLGITTSAYENHPLVVMGVPSEEGLLPVISGVGAVTPEDIQLSNQDTWVVQIGGDSDDGAAAWVWLQDLAIVGAHADNSFTAHDGTEMSFAANCAALRLSYSRHIHLYGLELYDSHTGLFVESGSEDVLVSSSWLHDNGSTSVSSVQNAFLEAVDVTFEYNRMGPMIDGSLGSNLLDRSAGLVARYNWFEGETTPIQIQNSSRAAITEDPGYNAAMLYGNVFLAPVEQANSQLVTYGSGDDSSATQRTGTLYFFHNTVISERSERTHLIMLPTSEQSAAFENNLVFAPQEMHTTGIMSGDGQLTMNNNWLPERYQAMTSSSSGSVEEQGTTTGSDPSFTDYANLDLHIELDSPCQGLAGELDAGASEHRVEYQYLQHQRRALRETTEDIGAYEG